MVKASSMEATRIPQRRKSYPAGFKLQVVKFAEENGNRAAGRKFGVSEKVVRDWRKAEVLLISMDKTKKANRGLKARWPKLEKHVCQWMLEQHAAGRYLTAEQLRIQAQAVAKQMNINDFAGGTSWYYRFLRRNRLHIRRRPTTSPNLPADLQAKVKRFPEFVVKQEPEEWCAPLACESLTEDEPTTSRGVQVDPLSTQLWNIPIKCEAEGSHDISNCISTTDVAEPRRSQRKTRMTHKRRESYLTSTTQPSRWLPDSDGETSKSLHHPDSDGETSKSLYHPDSESNSDRETSNLQRQFTQQRDRPGGRMEGMDQNLRTSSSASPAISSGMTSIAGDCGPLSGQKDSSVGNTCACKMCFR